MEAKVLIHKLLYQAFIEIREAAYEDRGMKGIFKISDLFHNVPLQLNIISENNGNYQELLTEIKKIARMKGYDSWLNNAIQNIVGKEE